MLKPHTVLGFGLWLIAISFLGIPATWRIRLYVLTGIVFVCLYLYRLTKDTIFRLADQESVANDTFKQNSTSLPSDGGRSQV